MKAFFAIVSREINERKALIAAAAVASLLPVLAPLLPSTGSNSPQDIREAVMWVMVAALVPIFSLLLGVNFVGRDLGEGRLGFFFAQPVSGTAIWFGKLTAVVLLIYSAQLIMLLPVALLSGEPWRIVAARGLFFEPLGVWASSMTMWVAPVAVILLAHALAIVWRARSMWIVVDLVALVLLVAASRWVISPFLQIFAAYVVLAVYAWLLAAGLIGLLVAGAFQLTCGRVDARRGHRAQSAVLWSVLAAAVLTAAAWGWWVRSATLEDLDRVNDVSVGSGDWIAVTGPSGGRMDYCPGFVVNTVDGRWVPAHSGSGFHERGVEFSDDMSRAVWTTPNGFEEMRLVTVDLSDADLKPERTAVVIQRSWRDMALSANGSRVAVVENDSVVAYDVDSGELLAAASIGGEFRPFFVHFESDDVAAVLTLKQERSSDDSRVSRTLWRRYRFDVGIRSLDGGEDIENPWLWAVPQSVDSPNFGMERRDVEGELHLFLVDSSNGDVIADLGEMPARWSDVRVVKSGRIGIIREKDGRHELDVFSQAGSLLHRVDLPDGGWYRFGGEVSPNRLTIGRTVWSSEDGEPAERSAIVADLPAGRLEQALDGVSPLLGGWNFGTSPGAWGVGTVASRLMLGEGGSLHLWDPETNELQQLIPVPD